MQMQLVKEGIHNYMVLPWEQEWQDGYGSRLFQYHKVPHFLSYEVRSMNGQIWLYYSLQFHTSLKSVMGHLPFTYERVYCMLESILDALDMTEEYMIEPDGIVWDSRAIYMDVESGRLQFIYYPDGNANGELRDLITEWLQYIDKKQDDIVLLVMGFYDVVTEQTWNLDALEKFRKQMGKSSETKVHNTPEQMNDIWEKKEVDSISPSDHMEELPQKHRKKPKGLLVCTGFVVFVDLILLVGFVAGILSFAYVRYLLIGILLLVGMTIGLLPDKEKESVDDIMQEYLRENRTQWEMSQEKNQIKDTQLREEGRKDKSSIIGETSLLSESDGITDNRQVLVMEQTKQTVHLESLEKDRYPVISLQDGSVVIGSMAEGCTYILKERGISRLHAKLMEKADGIYLLDLNSTNGTYLNGEAIEAGKDYRIEKGDLIAFAKCEYYVV